MRTAGFATISYTNVDFSTNLLFMIQMIIGGGPGGTAGGIKVTTATNISAAGSVSLTKVEDEATTVASGSEEIPYRDQTRTLFHYL